MTPDEQLEEWVKGNPIHNKDRDECCPDFSCCTGKIAPLEQRESFAKAHREGREDITMPMLMGFLAGELESERST